jgi:arsenite methyltransferase
MSGKCPYSGASATSAAAAPTPPAAASTGRCPFDHDAADDANAERTKDWSAASPAELKQHFTAAYNAVAEQAVGKTGNADISRVLMEHLGYTAEELAVVGSDVHLMQGTGNPHLRAAIAPGEFVADFGSGFGIDALIASAKVGPRGRVVGIDLAAKEVLSALERVSARGVRNVDFRIGDIERAPLDDGVVDVVISNGGFCLVGDKARGFAEIMRVLRPGGRFAISCTVRTRVLDPAVKWPSCIVAFASIETLLPMLADCGFVRCEVDRSNGSVDVWDEATSAPGYDPAQDVEAPIHKKVASGAGGVYAHLDEIDMDSLCERVTVVGYKPA